MMCRKTVLPNGVRIVSEQMTHVRSVSLGFWADVGARDEDAGNNGSAHFVEHMFFKGTKTRSAQQIAMELDVLGGMSNAFTSRENTVVYAKVLDSQLAVLVSLLGDLFLGSVFPEEEVARESQVILQEISMVEDTPDDFIHDLFGTTFWGGHPLGNPVLGSREVVAAMDSKKIIDYIDRAYAPERILIAASGKVDHDALVDLLAPAFSSLPSRQGPQPRRPPSYPDPRQVVFAKDLEQVHLVLGMRGLSVSSADRYKLLLLNTILGGNMSSRLFQEIREKNGLAYSIYSFASSYLDSGYLGIYLGVDPQTTNEALGLLGQELAKMGTSPVSDGELGNAKEYAKGGLFLSTDNVEARMMRLAQNEMYFGRDIPLDEVAAGVDAVTQEEVHELAARLLNGTGVTAVALGPVTESDIDWTGIRAV